MQPAMILAKTATARLLQLDLPALLHIPFLSSLAVGPRFLLATTWTAVRNTKACSLVHTRRKIVDIKPLLGRSVSEALAATAATSEASHSIAVLASNATTTVWGKVFQSEFQNRFAVSM